MTRDATFSPARVIAVLILVLAAPAVASAQIAAPYSSALDDDTGWTLASLWAVDGTPASVVPPITPPNSLNYNNGTDFSGQNSGAARSPAINLLNATSGTLTFQCWYQTETTGTTYDQRWFRIINADTGAQLTNSQLAGSGGAITCPSMSSWHEHSIDLTNVVGNNIQLEFFFNTVDQVANNYPGWFIDDILILTPDVTPPAAITDLDASGPTLNSITVSWTSPTDDDISGVAESFNLKFSKNPIASDADFANANIVASLPPPDVPGTPHSVIVTGLQEGTKYYFAIVTQDFAGNVSLLSNVVSRSTLAPIPLSTSGGAAAQAKDRYAMCGAGSASNPAAMILFAALVVLAAAKRAFRVH
jgi:hypothetical protein